MWGTSLLAEDLLASQEGLCSRELVMSIDGVSAEVSYLSSVEVCCLLECDTPELIHVYHVFVPSVAFTFCFEEGGLELSLRSLSDYSGSHPDYLNLHDHRPEGLRS